MMKTLYTLEEVEDAVFQALKDAEIPYEEEYWRYDEDAIKEMRRTKEGNVGVIGAFTLDLSGGSYLHVDIMACPGMDIIDGEEVFGENFSGRNVKVELGMDEDDTLEMTRWSCKKDIDEVMGYVEFHWRHRCGGNGQPTSGGETSDVIASSSEPTLDPGISQLMDDLESRTIRNSICRFLESLGFLGPQLALDQSISVNREGLLTYLIKERANFLDQFGGLTQAFAKSPQKRLPYIDLPAAVPIDLHIARKLDLYPYGREWLQEVMKRKGKNGERLSERRVRENLFDFMKKEGIPSIDIGVAKSFDRYSSFCTCTL